MKALKIMLDKSEISRYVVLMADEMYLQKGVPYSSGEDVGADEDGSLYKGVVVLMVLGLQKSSVFVIKASPKVKVDGHRLPNKISTSKSSLAEDGIKVRAVVTDNHSTNVSAFTHLTKMHRSSGLHCTKVPKNLTKTYLFFDSEHIVKNIPNNLLNAKKLAFSPISIAILGEEITCGSRYITWADHHFLCN